MRHKPKACFILLISLLFCAISTQATELPVEHFFKNYEFSNLSLSPDGKHLAAIAPVGERRNLVVIERATKKSTAVTSLKKTDIAGYQWANNTRLVFYLEADGNESLGLNAVNIDGSKPKKLAKSAKGVTLIPRVTRMIDRLKDDDKHILVSNNERRAEFPDIYQMDIYTGRKKRITSNPGNITGWSTDHDGRIRAAMTQEVSKDGKDVTQGLLYRADQDDEWIKVGETKLGEEPSIFAGFAADNKTMYMLSAKGRDKLALYSFDPTTKTRGDMIFGHDDVDVAGPTLSKKEHKLLAVDYFTDKPHQHFVDKEFESIQKSIDQALPDTVNNITSWTEDEKLAIVHAGSDRSPGTYYLLETNPLKLTFLAAIAARIKPEAMSKMKAFSYQARDGLTVPGYLTLPKDSDGKNLPLIVHPHGGPYGPRDYWGWNPEVQFLANRGYAVIQMNFRGSGGYGHKYQVDAWKQWGLQMQDDISDAVKWAVEQGIADPKRVCIYGASYGGYATMAGLTMTPELYNCGINYVGVADLEMLHDWDTKSSHDRSGAVTAWFHRAVGDWDNPQDKERMKRTSPLNLLDNLNAPLMIVHGRRDPRVEIKQAEELMDKMDDLKKPYIKLVKKKEGHGFRKEENRLELYHMMDTFLKKNL